MKNLLIRWFISAVSVWVAAQFINGMSLSGGLVGILCVAAVFGLINALIRPVVMFFALPGLVLTLGLLTFLINAGMLWLTAKLTDNLHLSGFWPTLWGSIVISITSAVLSMVFDDKKKKG
jgi:putative membrane protein